VPVELPHLTVEEERDGMWRESREKEEDSSENGQWIEEENGSRNAEVERGLRGRKQIESR